MSRVANVWLFALDEGSVTAKQIEDRFGLKRDSSLGPLYRLHTQGALGRIEKIPGDSTSRVKYTVTGECIIPHGIKLKEILK